eukprot:2630262-Alexandrium_andersonii.AAC.1
MAFRMDPSGAHNPVCPPGRWRGRAPRSGAGWGPGGNAGTAREGARGQWVQAGRRWISMERGQVESGHGSRHERRRCCGDCAAQSLRVGR